MKPSDIRLQSRTIPIQFLIKKINFSHKPYTNEEASILIESIILRIPLGEIKIDNSQGNFIAFNGNKRLSIIKDFLNNEIKLEHLEFLEEIKDKYLSEVPKNFKRRILESYINCWIIEKALLNWLLTPLREE